VTHNLFLRIIDTLVQTPEHYQEPAYMALVESEAGEVVAVALRTPPHALLLSLVQDFRAIELIAQDILKTQSHLSGVNAPIAVADSFADQWQRRTGQMAHLYMALRIHQLTAVEPIAIAQGHLRLATDRDRPLLVQWYQEFVGEALGQVCSEQEADSWLSRVLPQDGAYVWEDGELVSLVCGLPFSERGIVLNMVYTPPGLRQRGYASSSVATLSQQFLDRGYRYCVLFTNLANPTSNKIYRAIGYHPVADWNHYGFREAGEG
jgi:hypothetical protein